MSLALIGFPLQVGAGDHGGSETPLDPALNAEQREALEAADSPGLLYIHGPPGTGKTTTLATTIHSAVAKGRRVLAVAPSNAAVDILAEGVCRALQAHARFSEGLVVRCGETRAPAVRNRWAQAIDLSRLVETRLGGRKGLSRDVVIAESRRVLAEAAVVLTTAARTHLTELPRDWDVVVIDEAGMTPVPLAYHVASMLSATGTLILSGDHRQLPPVIRSPHRLVRRVYRSCLTQVVDASSTQAREGGIRVASLTRQYRMAPALGDWISTTFYDDRLVTDEAAAGVHSPQMPHALAVVDTSSLPTQSLRRAAGWIRANRGHVDLITVLINRLRQDPRTAASSIAVLTRYRVQAGALRRSLTGQEAVFVATVHAFQGHEADLVILDVSDPSGAPTVGDYLVHAPPAELGAGILNVALTRGRRAVVVADLTLLDRPDIPTGSAFRALIGHARAQGAVLRPPGRLGHRIEDGRTRLR